MRRALVHVGCNADGLCDSLSGADFSNNMSMETTPSAIPANARIKLSPRSRVQTDKVTAKPILVYPEGVLVLNPTGSAIVALCDGSRTCAEIATELSKKYNAPIDAISKDVAAYLGRLQQKNLIELLTGETP